jgi:hypothetical protein
MFATTRRRPIECLILNNPKPEGPPIGTFAGKRFAEFVRDAFGRLFVYSGVAPRRKDGGFDDAALGPGEFIMLPGLIYRHKGKAPSPVARHS